jgi:hypothetical protein
MLPVKAANKMPATIKLRWRKRFAATVAGQYPGRHQELRPDDPKAAAVPVNHWVAYGIPADVTGFAEGEVSKEGRNMSAARHKASASIPAVHRLLTCSPTTIRCSHRDRPEAKELAPGLTKVKSRPRSCPPVARQRIDTVGLFAASTLGPLCCAPWQIVWARHHGNRKHNC